MARTDYGAILSTKIADTSQAIRDVNKTVGTITPADWGTLIRGMKSGADYQNALDQMVEETATGSIASFTDGANDIPTKEVICHINPTETGTGEKSPQNPYVIGGVTEANITNCGKNLIDTSTLALRDVTGNNVLRASYAPVKCNAGKYTLSFSGSYVIYITNITNGYTHTEVSTSPRTITLTSDSLLLIRYSSSNLSEVNTNIQFENNASATAFEPYTGDTYTASFGQTVYGGTLNVTTGVLTITNVIKNLGEYIFHRLAYQDIYYFYAPFPDRLIASDNVMCEIFKYKGASASSLTSNYDMARSGSNNRLFFRADECTTEESFYELVNGFKVCYKLETPQTIQLTPQEIKTLLGANNIYHDCNGDIDVTYRANGALYVEQHS